MKFGRVRFRVTKISSSKSPEKLSSKATPRNIPYSRIQDVNFVESDANRVLTENLNRLDSSERSIISNKSSMFFEQQIKEEERVQLYTSGVGIDSGDEGVEQDKPPENKNEHICRV